jgi:hypothetical protein
MEIFLGICTVIGGVAAVYYFVDLHKRRKAKGKREDSFLRETIDKLNESVEIGSRLRIVVSPERQNRRFMSEGTLDLSKNLEARGEEIFRNLPQYYENDICAVVTNKPVWTDDPITIRYHKMKFSSVLARREQGLYTGIISANVLLYSEEAECLLLHRRSKSSYDFKSLIHTYGGANIPNGSGHRIDRYGIRGTALREIFEEADIGINLAELAPSVIIDEFYIQYIQTAYLGVNISPDEVKQAKPNWEGEPVIVPFVKLEDYLNNFKSWCLTGWTHVILWLASEPSFLKKHHLGCSAKDLANSVMSKYLTRVST